ncbi:UNVERIFIED_CONTAM: hypothetical protein PYX00_002100 [Menopon gallinae]|uniref:Selenocysteine lyase n=1 Tax=Menopon gallinae TaxID=328185 RepID=A0AAW2IFI0_9NEOP
MNSDTAEELIYMDYNATTPVAKEVMTSISESLLRDWGNPSSSHVYGQTSKESISKARAQIADMLGAQPSEITFTSGGTESNNMIIYGILQYFRSFQNSHPGELTGRPHIITTNVEHDSVILPIMHLTKEFVTDCSIVKVNHRGVIDVQDVISQINENTCLITVMTANNETGAIMPIAEIGEKLSAINAKRESRNKMKILFHTDAAQIIGKEKITAADLKVDYITVVGHKFYGPRIGCVWAQGPLYRVFHGGGQESGIRPGTENTPMIVGLGRAAELVTQNVIEYKKNMLMCREYLEAKLKEAFGKNVVINCQATNRLPNTVNASFIGDLTGGEILSRCKHLIASVGAACHGGQCSQVLINSGIPERLAMSAIRLSVGRETTLQDIDIVVADITQAIASAKKIP